MKKKRFVHNIFLKNLRIISYFLRFKSVKSCHSGSKPEMTAL